MAALRWWSDEIEAMRPEARAAVADGFAAFGHLLGDVSDVEDRFERARISRERHQSMITPHPEVTDRVLGGVRCRVATPADPPRAVYLHFHGGGMVSGSPEGNDIANVGLRDRWGIATVSVDYRLAPEHPWPAGPDDATAVAAWLIAHGADELGTDRILLGGESAGAYLAAAVALRIRDELDAIDRVVGCNLLFGVFDWSGTPSQAGCRPHEGPDLLTPEGLRWYTDCYLPDTTVEQRRDPRVSPAHADLTGLPPALFGVGTTDHLLDDSLVMAARWAAFGNPTELFVAPDMPHGFGAFTCGITEAWDAVSDAWTTAVLDA